MWIIELPWWVQSLVWVCYLLILRQTSLEPIALSLVNFSRTMKLIILDDYNKASEWAAKYIRNRILLFEPGPDKYFNLGLPTGTKVLAMKLSWYIPNIDDTMQYSAQICKCLNASCVLFLHVYYRCKTKHCGLTFECQLVSAGFRGMKKYLNFLWEHKGIYEKIQALWLLTGGTPLGCYKKLIEYYKNGEVSFQYVRTFNMDEYVGKSSLFSLLM